VHELARVPFGHGLLGWHEKEAPVIALTEEGAVVVPHVWSNKAATVWQAVKGSVSKGAAIIIILTKDTGSTFNWVGISYSLLLVFYWVFLAYVKCLVL